MLDGILDKICEQDLPGKSYVEQYLRHKYRRNCKSNTLRQAATSLVQFLTFFRNSGSIRLEQLSREDIEGFVEALQDRGLKPSTVNTRLRNVYAFVRFLNIEYKVVSWELMERKIKLKLPEMPLECLRVLLGHSSLEITRRYARLSDKTREEEYFSAMDRILKGDSDENDQCDR